MRSRIRIFGFTLAAIAVLGGLYFREYRRAEIYGRYLNYNYQRAFSELVTSVTDIDASLKKSVYSTTTAATCTLCTEIYTKSAVARMSLGELPIRGGELQQASEFISRVGDYAFSLTKRLTSGGDISDEDRESLKELSDTAGILSDNLIKIMTEVNEMGLTDEKIKVTGKRLTAKKEKSVYEALSQSYSHMISELPEMPRLIYDGRFSDHIAEMPPKNLVEEKPVDDKAALEAAANFTGVKQDKLKYIGEGDSNIDSYYFTGYVRGGNMTVRVSKYGGLVVSFMSSRKVEKGSLTPDDAVNVASDFLVSHGYNSMEPIGWTKQDGTVLVSFAYKEKDTIYYPDIICVSVALDNGSVTDFECTRYLMNHAAREFRMPAISSVEAENKLPDSLIVKKQGMAVISTDGKKEILCYEFRCRTEKESILFYINAQTGEEEKILIRKDDDNGVFTL